MIKVVTGSSAFNYQKIGSIPRHKPFVREAFPAAVYIMLYADASALHNGMSSVSSLLFVIDGEWTGALFVPPSEEWSIRFVDVQVVVSEQPGL